MTTLSKPNSLPCVEKIKLYGTRVGLHDLEAVLSAAPNVTKLEIGACKDLANGILKNIHASKMDKLEYLGLDDLTYTSDDLIALIKIAPYLRALDLREHKGSVTGLFKKIKKNFLSSLEFMCLNSTDVQLSDLKMIARAAPLLKKIDLAMCRQLRCEGFLKSPRFEFPELEEVYLQGINLTFFEIEYVLAIAPKLKRLHLNPDMSEEDLVQIPKHIEVV